MRRITGESGQEAFGERLAGFLRPGTVIHLRGEIGSGKTTLTRGLLRGLGIRAPIKSPTYTLVEPYEGYAGPVYHFDLYRLSDPEELQFFGAEEYFSPRSICILEWAERAGDVLPSPDIIVDTEYLDAESRTVRLAAHSAAGGSLLDAFSGDGGDTDAY
ncbi:tRNA (adenosine(37)-N6)-threonylcarbamoyltransferase complex ATPase subunit type 1 TsaE [Thiohalorhabdus methylotrophus]|uniref:tRNA threonylcarbamoyladenosine biosynthesis protein TsaE n=1 Tax=Thiohalorhabdus methylotrophus TaxID=3242694 RepID=A0ABV4TY90_9GAMM